jgi:hypothetical protein
MMPVIVGSALRRATSQANHATSGLSPGADAGSVSPAAHEVAHVEMGVAPPSRLHVDVHRVGVLVAGIGESVELDEESLDAGLLAAVDRGCARSPRGRSLSSVP